MRQIKLLILSLLTILFSISCTILDGSKGVFQIAALVPTQTTDDASSQSLLEALQKMQNELGNDRLLFTIVENVSNESAAAQLKSFAEAQYDLIIAHSAGYEPYVMEVAAQYPETAFALAKREELLALDNVFGYFAKDEESGYLNGVVAILLSQNQSLAVIHDTLGEDIVWYNLGFETGAREINSEVQIEFIVLDQREAGPAISDAIAAGADVFSGSSMDAQALAIKDNLSWLSLFTNQESQAENVVMSQRYDWTVAFDEILFEIENGVLGGKRFGLTYENSGIQLHYGATFPLPTAVLKISEEVLFDLIDGQIDLPGPP